MRSEKWDKKFIDLCKEIAKWSKDPSTKHGSIIVDDNNNIVSTGYNGPPRGVDDSKVPQTRPHKYRYYAHAEANSITAAAQLGRSTKGCTIYQTGPSCKYCWLLIANSGIKRLVHGDLSSKCVSKTDYKIQLKMAQEIGIEINKFE